MDKSLLTNLCALFIVAAGLIMHGPYRDLVLNTGLFALSGGVTNWLAVHMLFEKVPGFYGSGVIPARFEEFKSGIRKLVMEQFFNPGRLDDLFGGNAPGVEDGGETGLRRIVDAVDLGKAFHSLVDIIEQSSFGGVLSLFGGRKALEPLQDPFKEKMRHFLHDVSRDETVIDEIRHASRETLLAKVEHIVDRRLEELTPQLVKKIVQQMIRQHLGWLVVWGGVLGGVIGLVVTLALGRGG